MRAYLVSSLLVGALAGALPGYADAQALERPQRAFRGIFGGGGATQDPSRSYTSVTLLANGLGGYDDNAALAVAGGGAPTTALTTPAVGGYTGNFDATLRVFRGRVARNFTLSVGGSGNEYRDIPLEPNRTFTGSVGLVSEVGRRTTVQGGGSGGYTKNFAISSPLTSGADPETLPSSPGLFGIGNRPSINFSGTGGLTQQWTRRARTVFNYTHARIRFTDEDSGDSRTHNATVSYAHQVNRTASLTANYGYTDILFAFGAPGDDGRPSIEHRATGGVSILKRLSPTRTSAFSISAGAVRIASETGLVDPVPYETWAPLVSASSRIDINREWNLSGNYNRSAQVLDGLSTEAFFTDALNLAVSGLAGRRVELAFLTGFAKGTVAVDTSASEYSMGLATVQTRVALSRMLAVTANYSYYRYRFINTVLPVGVSPEFDRNAIRIGLSISLPLYGR